MGTRTRIGVMVGAVVAVSAAAPTPANAIPNPLSGLFDSLDPTKLVGKVLDQVFQWMFGYTPGELAAKVLKAVISNPDLGGDLFGPLREGVHQLIPAAVALLIFFLLTGLTFSLASDPSRAGVDIFKRLAAAIVGLIAAPQLFEQFNTFIGYVAQAVISTPTVQHSVADGLDGAFQGGQIGAVFTGLAMILLFILLCAKVVILALLAILYVATPFVMAAFVDPRMSHIAGVWLQSTALVQFVPVAWSGILLAFGALGAGGNLFAGARLNANFVDVAVALTLLAMLVFSIPVMLRIAWIGGFIPSMQGAGTMAWGGAQVAGALGGGRSCDLPALEQNAQAAMDDAAAPPAAEGDRRGGGGPAMDFGGAGDTSGDDFAGGGFTAASSAPAGLAPGVAPGSSAALPATTGATGSAAADVGAHDGAGASGAPDSEAAAAERGEVAPVDAPGDAAAGGATVRGGGASEGPGVSGAGDPLPAGTPVEAPSAATSSGAPAAAGAAATSATPVGESDGAGSAATPTPGSEGGDAVGRVPLALDGGDVRAASTAAPMDAVDVPAPDAASPAPAPAVTDPEQESTQR